MMDMRGCSLLFALAGCAHSAGQRPAIATTQETIAFSADEGQSRPLTIGDLPSPLVQEVAVPAGRRVHACFNSEIESVCFNVARGDVRVFDIVRLGRRYRTQLSAVRALPAATFTPAYQARHRGQILVLVPEVYEMVNIAIALTDYAANSPGRIVTAGEYYARVAAHFERYRRHPFVLALNERMRNDPVLGYARLKMNGYAFDFDDRSRIVRSHIYDRTGYEEDPSNTLLPLLGEMRSFAEETGFRAFYAANREFYESQIAFLRDDTDVAGMERWLRAQFPAVRPFDGVKVIFSPLAGNLQSLTTFESNGYRELQPHINFPYNSHPDISAAGNRIWRGTLLFGEMNHGFINPTAERYRSEIDRAIGSRNLWTIEANLTAYPNDQALFDEYMNFGLIVLYHHDRMTEADARAARERIERVMVAGRGFSRFAEFNAVLVDLYRNRQPGETIADLYPQIIAWFAAQTASATPT